MSMLFKSLVYKTQVTRVTSSSTQHLPVGQSMKLLDLLTRLLKLVKDFIDLLTPLAYDPIHPIK